jgi:phenylacetate-CoA ligase
VIRGYPSALSSLASELTDEDRTQIHPRFITTDSENLTPHMRLQIEQGFGVPVFDIYDCFECNVIAWQCPTRRQYHVMDAAVIVEILRDGRPVAPGESGELIITPLHSWAAPLIRYRIGDLVERGLDQCPCGAPNSCVAQVQGRLQDRLALADGRYIHPQLFATLIYPLLPNLWRYQIVQEEIDRIVVRLQPVPTAPPSPEQVETMKQRMTRDLGDAIRLEVELVENIPSEPSGKFRTFRCLVPGHGIGPRTG